MNFILLKVSLSENTAGRGVFKLSDALQKKRAVINVQCTRKSFKYVV